MPVETCKERTSDDPNAQDAVWVANGQGNKLYYPYVSSCVSVTLVFQNGLIGGHASQSTPDAQNSQLRPAQNLRAVINRMIAADPGGNTRGAFMKIYFIGTTSDLGWKLDEATNAITTHFGQLPPRTEPKEFSLSPVDIVFDTHNTQLYVVQGIKSAQGADATIQNGALDQDYSQ